MRQLWNPDQFQKIGAKANEGMNLRKPILSYEQALSIYDATNHYRLINSKCWLVRCLFKPMALVREWAWNYVMKHYQIRYSDENWID